MEAWTGFLIGLFGSLHCIGMCGPIALALPLTSDSQIRILFSRVLYNLGRIITYTFMGLILGALGHRLYFWGFQNYLSIIIGVIILIFLFIPKKIRTRFTQTGIAAAVLAGFRKIFSGFFRIQNDWGFLFIGIMNGFLPCGLVYAGLAGAISTGDTIKGALFMLSFGIGTFPVMLGVSFLGRYLSAEARSKFAKLVPVFAFILALLFILRGLNLGIPYISPSINLYTPEGTYICH